MTTETKTTKTPRSGMPRFERLAALAVLSLGGACFAYIAAQSHHYLGGWELAMMAIGTLGALITAASIWRGSVWPRIAVATGLLGVGVALLASWLFSSWPFDINPFHDIRHVGFLVAVTALTAVALPLRLVWGRWMALGLAVGGLLSGGMNAASMLLYAPHTAANAPVTWLFIIGVLWSATIWLALSGPTLRQAFLARSAAGQLWASPHRVVRIVRWTILANLVAIPMLLVYAWSQPIVPSTVCSALTLAAVLGVASLLAMARKVVGALLLSLGGLGMLAQTFATFSGASGCDTYIVGYYAVFWLPAAMLSLVCGAMLARPVWQLLRK